MQTDKFIYLTLLVFFKPSRIETAKIPSIQHGARVIVLL